MQDALANRRASRQEAPRSRPARTAFTDNGGIPASEGGPPILTLRSGNVLSFWAELSAAPAEQAQLFDRACQAYEARTGERHHILLPLFCRRAPVSPSR